MAMGGEENPREKTKHRRSVSWSVDISKDPRLPSPVLELPERVENIKILKEFLQSALWKYPLHAFIGEVVKGQP